MAILKPSEVHAAPPVRRTVVPGDGVSACDWPATLLAWRKFCMTG